MKERLVWLHDDVGTVFLCELDRGLCDDFVCTLDSDRDIPEKIKELSDHERSSCWNVSSVVGN
jgi:hypothetical protein